MDEGPVPRLQPRFSLRLVCGEAAIVGPMATGGGRCLVPVMGGVLEGEGLRAEVLPGHGGETWLDRIGGVAVVDAVYLLRTAGGDIARLIGSGYGTVEPHYAGTRMTCLFETSETGPLAPLAERVFVAQRPAGSDTFEIAIVL